MELSGAHLPHLLELLASIPSSAKRKQEKRGSDEQKWKGFMREPLPGFSSVSGTESCTGKREDSSFPLGCYCVTEMTGRGRASRGR